MNMHNSCIFVLVTDDDSQTRHPSFVYPVEIQKAKKKRKRKMPEIHQRRERHFFTH